uniref:Uncharacterized protein n=1 Tax=Micrurus corallinus TaxID=54390 RepID=A0A2D4GE88_MICCO
MQKNVSLPIGQVLAAIGSMGSACADITLQDTIVRSVHHYTMTSPGSLAMEKLGQQMNAKGAAVTITQIAAILNRGSGWPLGRRVEGSVITASTTLRVSGAKGASLVFTETEPNL